MKERVTWGGRYAIFDELASGGMATIYLAVRLGSDPAVPQVVALKKLADQFAKQPEFVAMFLDEAHLAARIRHPNVVATYEFLRTDDGLGIVMDLVVGESLMQLVRGPHSGPQLPGPLPVSLAIVCGALDGLHAAHQISDDSGKAINLVHRDVSPHNIIVGADGVARVIDFGVAKAAGRLQTTDVGVLKGKFAYMSPEQIRGATVDRRTDVYATGIVLWEALTGRKLFRAKTNEELLTQRTSGKALIPPPSAANPDVPPALDALVARALANDPSERFGSALAMAESIRAEFEVAGEPAVAEWVRSRAGERLGLLEAKRRKLEESLSSPLGEPPRRDSVISSISVKGRAAQAPLIDVPDLPPPPSLPEPAAQRKSVKPGDDAAVSSRDATPPPAVRQRFGGDLVLDEGGPGLVTFEAPSVDVAPLALAASMHAPVSLPSDRLSMGRVSRSRPEPAARSYRGAAVLLLLLLVAALATGAVFEGPALLRARVLAAAARYGLAITIERAELSHGGLMLTGVKGSLSGCPAVKLSAGEVDVDLDRAGELRGVRIPSYELTITGPASDVAAQLAAWRQGRHTPLDVEAKAGHLVWSRPAIPTLIVEALDVDLALSAAADAALTVDSPALLVNLPRAHMGPWRGHFDSTAAATHVAISFDPSVREGPPSASVLTRPTEGARWSIDVPRASTFKAGIPAELFGLAADLAIEVALHGELSASGEALTGEGEVGLYGLQVGSGRGSTVPVDLVVSGSVAGDPRKPLTLNGGKLAVGKGTGPVMGTIVLQDDGVRVEIDRPGGHAGGAPLLSLDTRDWTAAVKGAGPTKPATGK